jgi:hypothetical protein
MFHFNQPFKIKNKNIFQNKPSCISKNPLNTLYFSTLH